ncbi:MAG: hypothetical protein Q9217_006179 [Psora testacea]
MIVEVAESMTVSAETRSSFIPIIDSILAASDLNTISEKRIRKGLQAAVEYDISPQKDAIKELIMARFDIFMAKKDEKPQTNGDAATSAEQSSVSSPNVKSQSPPAPKKHNQEADEEELSEVIDSPKPKKKRKVEHDSDAAYAAKLQAMENSRMRSTRGGGPKKANIVKKKSPKKKSTGRVKAEDDSDLEGSGSEVKEKKVNRSTGFHVGCVLISVSYSAYIWQKELMLSTPLSALLDNVTKLSRPQTVKRIWAYVRANNLQDPNDKRMILCDDGMKAVFKQDKVHMFTMNKILNQNLYAMDE